MDKGVEKFVSQMADALNKGSVKQMTHCSMSPVVFVTDDNRQICQTEAEIDIVNQLLLDSFKKHGVIKHIPKIVQCIRLSDSVFFVTVNWQFAKADDTIQLSSNISYTLQKEGEKLNMLVAVIKDYREIVSDLLSSIQENK